MFQVQALVVGGLFLFFALFELGKNRFFQTNSSPEDRNLEITVFAVFPAILIPSINFATNQLMSELAPQWRDALAHWPWWLMILGLLVFDDMAQYWWHRLSHSPLMWPLHRAHHSAPYMSMRVVYRNNFFYYALMPSLWLSQVMVFLGFGWVYVGYTIVKMTVIIGAHSSVRWDEALYRHSLLRKPMWLVERIISTPATHFAHHALTQEDSIGHYKGNYGNLLFFWDVLFGTALITRQYPPHYGLPDDLRYGAERWYVQFLFPLFRSKRNSSALKEFTTQAVASQSETVSIAEART
jgi:sterol desaturase/sphingolipid hydroxylase (fatty acid hydroxylase superfamily)